MASLSWRHYPLVRAVVLEVPVHQKSIRPGVARRRSARCTLTTPDPAPESTWNSVPTTTPARREIGSARPETGRSLVAAGSHRVLGRFVPGRRARGASARSLQYGGSPTSESYPRFILTCGLRSENNFLR